MGQDAPPLAASPPLPIQYVMLRPSLSIALLVAACGSPAEDTDVEPVSLEGWQAETIPLPPEFAPGMPAGSEVLLFAPGMFDAEAEDYWSYVFLMRIDCGGLDADGLTALFEEYYDGLINLVAESRGLAAPADPANCTFLEAEDGHYDGRVELVDAFGSLQEVELNVIVRAIARRSPLRIASR